MILSLITKTYLLNLDRLRQNLDDLKYLKCLNHTCFSKNQLDIVAVQGVLLKVCLFVFLICECKERTIKRANWGN